MIDATQLAEAIVDRFSRGEIDETELETAIAAAIDMAAPRKPTRLRSEHTKAMEKTARQMADPRTREEFVLRRRERERLRRQNNLEKFRAKDRLAQRRARERDPEGFREKSRVRTARRAARKPASLTAKHRRAFRSKQTLEQKTANALAVREAASKALPAGLPAPIRDDVIAAVLLAYAEGRITIKEANAEAKKALTAHNRMFDAFKTKSLDASVPGMEGLRLIDTIADDHPKF